MSKQYIFGYGSLVSAEDVARTLGRVPSLIHPVELRGWIREWGVVIDNTDAAHRCVRLADGTMAPGCIAVLNVRLPEPGEEPTHPNGVLFEVNDDDLRKMDEREAHYRRVEVTRHVVNKPTGIIYTYTGRRPFLKVDYKARTVIPGSYHDLVGQAFMALDPEMHKKYIATTRAPDLPIHHESVL